MVRKTKEEAERTYHTLLDAAAKIFIRQGVAKTTLTQIATEAGLTRGAVYWHFKNKEAVIQALWFRDAKEIFHEFLEAMRNLEGEDVAGQFRSQIKGVMLRAVSDPKVGLVLRIIVHNMEFTDEETELQTFFLEKDRLMVSAIASALTTLNNEGLVKSALPPQLLAYSLMSYAHGLLHTYYSPGQTDLDLQKDGPAVMDLFLDAVLVG